MTMNPSTAVTAEARLAERWTPPTEALATAIERREAFRSAIAALKTRGHADTAPIRLAIASGDRDDVITAFVQTALGEFLDRELQRPGTTVHEISAELEQALVEAIHAAAPAILASLPASSDADYLRDQAELSTASSLHVVGFNGQPARTRLGPVSLHRTLVPR